MMQTVTSSDCLSDLQTLVVPLSVEQEGCDVSPDKLSSLSYGILIFIWNTLECQLMFFILEAVLCLAFFPSGFLLSQILYNFQTILLMQCG